MHAYTHARLHACTLARTSAKANGMGNFRTLSHPAERFYPLHQLHRLGGVGEVRQRCLVVQDAGDEVAVLVQVAVSDAGVDTARQLLSRHRFHAFLLPMDFRQLRGADVSADALAVQLKAFVTAPRRPRCQQDADGVALKADERRKLVVRTFPRSNRPQRRFRNVGDARIMHGVRHVARPDEANAHHRHPR